MKTLLQFILLQLICISLQSQTTFQKTYGVGNTAETGYTIKATSNFGYILLMQYNNQETDSYDIRLSKVNFKGDVSWEQDYTSPENESELELEVHPSGDYIIRANSLAADGTRSFVLKRVLAATGEEVWSKQYDDVFSNIITDFVVNELGEIVLLIPENAWTYGVVAYDDVGNKKWENKISVASQRALASIEVTQDGGYIVAGTAHHSETGLQEMLLYKMDSQGNKEWDLLLNGSIEGGWAVGGHAFQASDGDYLIAGQISDGYYLICKIDESGGIIWQKQSDSFISFDDTAHWRGMETPVGDFLFISNTYDDGYILKISEAGEISWSGLADFGRRDYFHSIDIQIDGTYWVLGYSHSFNGTGRDALLTAYTPESGQITFLRKTYGQTGNEDGDVAITLTKGQDGNYWVFGYSNAFNEDANDDWYLLNIHPNGELNWQKTYDYRNEDNVGYRIVTIPSGGYGLYGTSLSENEESSNQTTRLTKIGDLGEEIWTHTYDSLRSAGFNFSATATMDGGFAIAGRSIETGMIRYMKLDQMGEVEWSKSYTGLAVYNIQELADGGLLICGIGPNLPHNELGTYLPMQAVKTDASGNIEWSFGEEYNEASISRVFEAAPTQDGKFVLTGYQFDGAYNMFSMPLVKLDAQGNVEWKQNIGGEEETIIGYDVTETDEGDYVFMGVVEIEEPSFQRLAMLYKTDKDGNEIWRKFYGNNLGTGIALYDMEPIESGGFALTGVIRQKNSINACLITTDSEGNTMSVNVFSPSLQYNFNIAPNPNNGQFHLSFEGNIGGENLQLSILDIAGRQLEEKAIPPITQQVDLSHLSSGTYFVKLGNGQQFSTKRVVIE